MSVDYAIKIKLATENSEKNILKILEKGAQKGFIYYEKYFTKPITSLQQTANNVKSANENNDHQEAGVFTILENETNAVLRFTKTEDGFMEFAVGAFGIPKRKGNYLDFAYYLRMFLDLCEDFPIVEVKTEVY